MIWQWNSNKNMNDLQQNPRKWNESIQKWKSRYSNEAEEKTKNEKKYI